MMRPRSPPRLAAWLLRNLTNSYRSESLAGDLLEEYQRGRGNLWYWRQVLAAVWATAARTVRVHGFSFIGAQAAAFLLLRAEFYSALPFNRFVRQWHQDIAWSLGLDDFAYHVASFVARASHITYHALVWASVGYVLARVHGHYRKTALLLFFLVSAVPANTWQFSHKLANAFRYPTGGWLGQLAQPTVFLALDLTALILGGLWFARSRPRLDLSAFK
jgi:hypothetical protein